MRKGFGITGKLIFSSVCIFLGLGVGVTWYSVSQLRAVMSEQIVRRVEAQALNWIEVNYNALTLTGGEARNQRLRELKERKEIAYVILLDAEKRAVAESAVPVGLAVQSSPLGGAPNRVTQTTDAKGRRYFELTIPLSAATTNANQELGAMFELAAKNQPSGWVRVGVDRQEVLTSLGAVVPQSIALYGGLVLLALLVTIVLVKRMVTPIVTMGRVANQIAAGNLSERVEQGRRLQDEVGELVRNFNQMATRLSENRDEMNLLYAGLEEKVRERTLELEQANQRLRDLDTSKSQFLSTVSHELRTPLTSIKAYAEILLDSPHPDPEMRRRFLGIIDKESDRLTRLISDLLDLAKIESGAVNWRIADTDLRRVVDQAAVSLASLAEEKAIQLRVLECAPMPVKVDADRIQQVITNLIGNALKFSERSGRVEVQLRGATTSGPRNSLEGDYAVVSIADSGPGIPPEDQERVFERFYRGAKHRPSSPGTGLGLTISREIVLHHQGEIWMESQPGAGSTFYFSLPMRSEIPASTRAHSEGKA